MEEMTVQDMIVSQQQKEREKERQKEERQVFRGDLELSRLR